MVWKTWLVQSDKFQIVLIKFSLCLLRKNQNHSNVFWFWNGFKRKFEFPFELLSFGVAVLFSQEYSINSPQMLLTLKQNKIQIIAFWFFNIFVLLNGFVCSRTMNSNGREQTKKKNNFYNNSDSCIISWKKNCCWT